MTEEDARPRVLRRIETRQTDHTGAFPGTSRTNGSLCESGCVPGTGPALYGAGGWILEKNNLHQLRQWEFSYIRSFPKLLRISDLEGQFEYNSRTNRLIMKMFANYSIDPIYVQTLKAQFNWAWTWWNFKHDFGEQALRSIKNQTNHELENLCLMHCA